MPTFVKHHVVQLQRIQGLGPAAHKLHTALNGPIYDRQVVILAVWDGRVRSLEQVLIETKFIRKIAQCSLEATGEVGDLTGIEAFVVNSSDVQDNPQIATLGKKRMLIEKRADVNQGIERTRCLMFLPNLAHSTRHHEVLPRSRTVHVYLGHNAACI